MMADIKNITAALDNVMYSLLRLRGRRKAVSSSTGGSIRTTHSGKVCMESPILVSALSEKTSDPQNDKQR